MDLRRPQLGQPLPVFLVDVDGDPRRGLRGAVQPFDRRRPDIDPRPQRPGQIPHRDRRIVGSAQASGEFDALGELEAVREQARDQEFVGFRRMPRNPEREVLVDVPIGVGEIDLEDEDGRGDGHDQSRPWRGVTLVPCSLPARRLKLSPCKRASDSTQPSIDRQPLLRRQ